MRLPAYFSLLIHAGCGRSFRESVFKFHRSISDGKKCASYELGLLREFLLQSHFGVNSSFSHFFLQQILPIISSLYVISYHRWCIMLKSMYNQMTKMFLHPLPKLLKVSLKLMLWTARANGIKRSLLKDPQNTVPLFEFISWAGIRNGMKPFLVPSSVLTFDLEVLVKSVQRDMNHLKLCA